MWELHHPPSHSLALSIQATVPCSMPCCTLAPSLSPWLRPLPAPTVAFALLSPPFLHCSHLLTAFPSPLYPHCHPPLSRSIPFIPFSLCCRLVPSLPVSPTSDPEPSHQFPQQHGEIYGEHPHMGPGGHRENLLLEMHWDGTQPRASHPEVLGVHMQLVTMQFGQLGEGVLDVVQVLHSIPKGGEHFLAMGADHGVAKDGSGAGEVLHGFPKGAQHFFAVSTDLGVTNDGGGAGEVPEVIKEPLGPGVDDQQPAERRGTQAHTVSAAS
uniref:Uncharacterized protein n=1 Tax=Gallus gallus TaxID=9031 RepID=A0A8V0X9F5_CHICK